MNLNDKQLSKYVAVSSLLVGTVVSIFLLAPNLVAYGIASILSMTFFMVGYYYLRKKNETYSSPSDLSPFLIGLGTSIFFTNPNPIISTTAISGLIIIFVAIECYCSHKATKKPESAKQKFKGENFLNLNNEQLSKGITILSFLAGTVVIIFSSVTPNVRPYYFTAIFGIFMVGCYLYEKNKASSSPFDLSPCIIGLGVGVFLTTNNPVVFAAAIPMSIIIFVAIEYYCLQETNIEPNKGNPSNPNLPENKKEEEVSSTSFRSNNEDRDHTSSYSSIYDNKWRSDTPLPSYNSFPSNYYKWESCTPLPSYNSFPSNDYYKCESYTLPSSNVSLPSKNTSWALGNQETCVSRYLS